MKKVKKDAKKSQAAALRVLFPVSAKLVIIITVLLFVSLGLITTLVAVSVRRDVEQTAWANERSINNMSRTTAEFELSTVQTKTSVLLNDIAVLGSLQNINTERLSGFFFDRNPEIAAIAVQTNVDGAGAALSVLPALLQNTKFFTGNNISPGMIDAFLSVYNRAFNRAEGGVNTVLNAAPVLNDLPILAMFYLWQGDSHTAPVAVFFSSENITGSFGTGANSTVLINDAGDLLVSVDLEALKNDANISALSFVQEVLESDAAAMEGRYRDRDGREFFAVSNRLSAGNAIAITTIPSEVVFEGINATTRRNIYLSAGVWFLSLLFLWFFAKTISNPLETLTEATGAIENGDYHLDIKSGRQDETGVLTRSVLSMSHVLENFEVFTNKEIARLARQGKLEIGGTVKQATIFFSDIRSFTAMSEKLTPNEVVSFLNEYMEIMVSCILVTGGAVDKFIGDAIMAYWGAIETSGSAEQDALNGVSAALMMRASLASFNKDRGGDKRPVIKIGCGLNSGNIVAGQIGASERVVFTVIGDAVSFADRTETFNKPFGTELLVTENTYKLIGDKIIAEEMGEVTEKGKKVKIYAVVNVREEELAAKLLDHLEQSGGNDMDVCRRYLGPGGPKTVADIRALIGIPTPDLSKLNLDEEEKKYSVPAGNKKPDAGGAA
jgi:adenylate cyclase